MAVGGSSLSAEWSLVAVGELESVGGVAGDVEESSVEQVVAPDAQPDQQVEIGSAVLEITKPDARCAITTQDPDTGERDLDTLRTILNYRGFRPNDTEKRIDFGVLGEVLVSGRISVGDEVRVARSAGASAVAAGATL